MNLGCLVLGHAWEWVRVREGFGIVERLRCRRCGEMPGYPLGGAQLVEET